MFPGKAGHSRGLRPASYGSAERSRVRRHLRFPGSSSPTRSGVTAPGLGHRRTAVRHPASCLRPGPARRVPWRRIRARTTRWRTRSRGVASGTCTCSPRVSRKEDRPCSVTVLPAAAW